MPWVGGGGGELPDNGRGNYLTVGGGLPIGGRSGIYLAVGLSTYLTVGGGFIGGFLVGVAAT